MAKGVDSGVEWLGSSRSIIPEADVLLGIFLDTAEDDAVLRVMRDHERNQTILRVQCRSMMSECPRFFSDFAE